MILQSFKDLMQCTNILMNFWTEFPVVLLHWLLMLKLVPCDFLRTPIPRGAVKQTLNLSTKSLTSDWYMKLVPVLTTCLP